MDGVDDALDEVLERQVRLELVRELEDPLEHLGAALEPLVHGLHLAPQVPVLKRKREVVREDGELLKRLRRHEGRVIRLDDENARDERGGLEGEEDLVREPRVQDQLAPGALRDPRRRRRGKERRLELALEGEPVEKGPPVDRHVSPERDDGLTVRILLERDGRRRARRHGPPERLEDPREDRLARGHARDDRGQLAEGRELAVLARELGRAVARLRELARDDGDDEEQEKGGERREGRSQVDDAHLNEMTPLVWSLAKTRRTSASGNGEIRAMERTSHIPLIRDTMNASFGVNANDMSSSIGFERTGTEDGGTFGSGSAGVGGGALAAGAAAEAAGVAGRAAGALVPGAGEAGARSGCGRSRGRPRGEGGADGRDRGGRRLEGRQRVRLPGRAPAQGRVGVWTPLEEAAKVRGRRRAGAGRGQEELLHARPGLGGRGVHRGAEDLVEGRGGVGLALGLDEHGVGGHVLALAGHAEVAALHEVVDELRDVELGVVRLERDLVDRAAAVDRREDELLALGELLLHRDEDRGDLAHRVIFVLMRCHSS